MTSRALLLCGVALFAGGSLAVTAAQGPNAAAQVHLERARAAAYRPGHSLMMLYENVCADALSAEGPEETFKIWSASATPFQDIAAKAGADTYLTIHPSLDDAEEKIHALKYRKPGDPHPLVSKDNLNRFLTIIKECTDAQ